MKSASCVFEVPGKVRLSPATSKLLSSKYFAGIAISSVIASLLGTALYMFTAELVETAIPNANEQTRFFSNVNVATNAVSLIGQMFVVRHVVRRFGIGVSLALLPAVSGVSR